MYLSQFKFYNFYVAIFMFTSVTLVKVTDIKYKYYISDKKSNSQANLRI